MNNVVFGKIMEKCEKIERYKTCDNRKKELFSIRTKAFLQKSYYQQK